jgi:hypothetical protein
MKQQSWKQVVENDILYEGKNDVNDVHRFTNVAVAPVVRICKLSENVHVSMRKEVVTQEFAFPDCLTYDGWYTHRVGQACDKRAVFK